MSFCTFFRSNFCTAGLFFFTSVSSKAFPENCFEMGVQQGSFPFGSPDTVVQTDLFMLRDSDSKLESDSIVRAIKVCYQEKKEDPSLFSLQLEVWSRKTSQNMWLSPIGNPKIGINGAETECEIH